MYMLKMKLHFPFENLKIKLPQKKVGSLICDHKNLRHKGLMTFKFIIEGKKNLRMQNF